MQIESNVSGVISTINDEAFITDDQGFQRLLSNHENGDSDTISTLLELIMVLLSVLKGEDDSPESGVGGTAGGSDSLADSLSELATAITSLAESISGNSGGGNVEPPPPPPLDPRDLNGDGVTTVFEVTESFTMNLSELQSQAKTPLDYIAGGRAIV